MNLRQIFRVIAALLFLFAALGGCDDKQPNPPARYGAELARTSNGIVHIRADNFRSLGYGLGFAYAQDNICMMADSILTVRGERSRYFGPNAFATRSQHGEYGAAIDYLSLNNLDSDFFFKGYVDLTQLRAGYAAGKREIRDLLTGYAAGYNRFLEENRDRLPAACHGAPWVRPISLDDMYLLVAEKALHGSGEVFGAELVAAARDVPTVAVGMARQAARLSSSTARTHEPLGSNALAVGKDLTVDGRGMLLGNPHYPWTSTDRFYQVHLTVPGSYDVMGVSLGGLPIVVIGFNQDVAWTHTVTKAIHFTTFKLALDRRDPSGTTYFYDGMPLKMSSRVATVEILQPNGSVTSRSKTFFFSRQGAVMVKPEAGAAWTADSAVVLADANRNNTRLLEQWLAMGQASSVRALRSALVTVAGLPWINTVAADRDGEVMYIDASMVPHLGATQFSSNCLLLPSLLTFDGSRSVCAWGRDAGAPEGVFSPALAPTLIRTDYVGNSNDAYWLSNSSQLLRGPAPFGYSPLYGATDIEQTLRTRIGFIQMDEVVASGRRFELNDLYDLLFANRIYAAELILPDFLPVCLAAGDATTMSACQVLAAWDRRANLDSRGAVLFREFWNSAVNIPGKWRIPFNAADPVHTPRGMAPDAAGAMLATLKAAAQKLLSTGVPLDGSLGAYQSDTRNGVRFAIHGGIGDVDGSYNSIHMDSPLEADGYHTVAWGTSYIQVVGFDATGPVARGLLAYGQSTDPQSPYYADQLPLYSEKHLQQLPFTAQQIRADRNYQVFTLTE
ncbi:penicillin acylase family protein [Rugamonas sp. CCM 8940]|uniref:penicillin acylase family protein n=1 Tax=Rugamonas sp. CCM 8940 TaxID=2765359 RepID=UPI00351C4809